MLETTGTVCVVLVSIVVVASFVLDRVTKAGVSARGSAPPPGARAVPPAPLPKDPVSLAGLAVEGSVTAKVGILEASDLQCPYCGKFARETLPAIEARYVTPGRVRLAFEEFPLPMHPFAEKAAEAAECAGRQGQFWPFEALSFAHQDQLDDASLRARARGLKVDAKRFDACLAGDAAAVVARQAAAARALQVTGTPTFLVGTIDADGRLKVRQRLTGAQPLAAFQSVLDRLLGADAGPTRH